MTSTPPSLTATGGLWPRTVDAAEGVVTLLLAAHKDGDLAELLQQRPLLCRRLARRWLAPVWAASGGLLTADGPQAPAVSLLLRWAVQQLRPDTATTGSPIDRRAWLQQTRWRPMLALSCHFGFDPVPDFSEQYRRHAGESVAENLCGLWSVGPSSYYRYLAKGKRALTELLLAPAPGAARRASLRQLVAEQLSAVGAEASAVERTAWHAQQAAAALAARDAVGALWHQSRLGDVDALCASVKRFKAELAHDAEAAWLLDECLRGKWPPEQRIDLLLARATLWRSHNDEERERQAYEQALQLAGGLADKFRLGVVYCALGRFNESRDTDRAFACFEEGAELLRRASQSADGSPDPARVAEYLGAVVKLAWLCVLRNDPRSRVLLESADGLRDSPGLPDELLAMLEQTWGEVRRRASEFRRALEHTHRALNIYERLGDLQQVLATYSNLSILYTETKDFARAVGYGRRVLEMAERVPVEPYVLAGTQINLGATLFMMEDYGAAIAEYQRALALATQAHLPVFANRAHYNLAEAFFKRFQVLGDPADETAGDTHVAAGQAADPSETDSFLREATLKLKDEILGPNEGFALTRLIPEEHAAHPDEMAEVQALRRLLAVPASADVHIRAHLAVSNSYMAIAVKEREAALRLIQRYRPAETFAAELDQLRITYGRALSHEQAVAEQWAREAGDLLQGERLTALLDHLFHSQAVQKAAFAQICALSPATASKYLNELARRGLLEQSGKGPSTRYSLPGSSVA